MRSTDSISAFVDWSRDDQGMLILRDVGTNAEAGAALDWGGAPLRCGPIEGFLDGGDLAGTSTGPWHDKLHCWMADGKPFGPQSQPELQSEYFVPIEQMEEALARCKIVCADWPLLYCEIRVVRGDSQLLSPYTGAHGQDTVAITTGIDGTVGVSRMVRMCGVLEEALGGLGAKPHWGKMFGFDAGEIQEMYGTRLERFREERDKMDPERKFTNPWLDQMLLD
eukprot:TRINITY_DN57142_c0_g1_i1.p1 TRINITY_DN57142_c0_g1~~TRINITY_DN57142_c0_g1_i1.p1  ORF type:complete len:223 (-),score=39.81 TRINITY_DN57142_c0_g1_i1:161-829(-)